MRLFTQLDYGWRGRVHRSCLPFSDYYDPDGACFELARWYGVRAVVMLSSDEECRLGTGGRDLRGRYREHGWTVVYLPTPDGGVPELAPFLAARDQARQLLGVLTRGEPAPHRRPGAPAP